ncbi:MAG: hypothetical protein VX951_13870 [Planctomycetota bacterium]|nr:hypothetical protein [Planctomycetota bacterium]
MLLTLRTLCAIALAAATSRALPPAPIAGVPTPQELVSVKGVRQPLLGTITGETERELVFNPYRSTHAVMVYGIMRYPKTRVRSRRSGIPAHEEFHMSLIQAEDDADKLCGLAAWCKKRRLKQERLLALEAALRANPEHGAALKAMTKTRSTAFLHSDRLSNEDLNEALSNWLANEDADARARSAKALIKTYKLPYKSWYLARAFRSSQQPTGKIHDRKLTLQGDKIAGVYTLYVPGDYDPLKPTALFVGLHGGGPTDDGKGVLGNGRQAFGLYSSQLRKRNYIAVFPTALRAPWRSGVNDPWIRALVAEIQALYNIDLNRVYLAGHSMGGYGTWHFGPKYCDRWAAIAPMSGGGSNGIKQLRDTSTFVYLYHGADDRVVGCRNSRAAAKQMLSGGNDFIYTELPDSGHGLPGSIVEEMFTFFERKRLLIKKRVQVRPRSSFLDKPGKDEIQYFGKL